MIRAHVVDPAALASRSPAEVTAYLLSQGWQLAEHEGIVQYWRIRVDAGEAEILQPLDQSLSDYPLRMAEALRTLGLVEDRSELEILRDISSSTWDVCTVRLFPADAAPGMISVDAGISAHEGLRGLVNAAAYPVFARQDRAVQPTRRPTGLVDFMRTVRFGVASEGSYVLTVHTPIPPRLRGQPSLGEELERLDEPVQRRVSLRLEEAVRAAHVAADAAALRGGGLTPFTESITAGVSANLCEALTALTGDGEAPFDITMRFAAVRRVPEARPALRFQPHHISVLREAAAELRARSPEESVVVTGEVVRLHREGADLREIGVVGHVDEVDGLRRIWVRLPPEDYELAVQAHHQMRQVTARGDLVRLGTRTYLHAATGFRLLGAAGDD